MGRPRPGVDWKDGTTCHCKNCHCYNVIEIPCSNDFLVCQICLVGKCSSRKNKPKINYIKIATNMEENQRNLEKAMQTL